MGCSQLQRAGGRFPRRTHLSSALCAQQDSASSRNAAGADFGKHGRSPSTVTLWPSSAIGTSGWTDFGFGGIRSAMGFGRSSRGAGGRVGMGLQMKQLE
jgi:hypothetical protein